MTMNLYNVEFWYGTDLRTDRTVEASSPMQALAIACNTPELCDWCEGSKHFHIIIEKESNNAVA